MNKPLPDTDPLKRDEPGETGRVPGNDVGGGGRPSGKPDERGTEIPARPGRPTPGHEPDSIPSEVTPPANPGGTQP